MSVTLREIAGALGVSISSVSLVLNGKDQGRVNREMAERIRATARDMGYQPNLLAKALKTRRTNTIGVIADNVASVPFASPLLSGAQEAARAAGYFLLITDIGGHPELEADAISALVQRDVDALIVATDYHRIRKAPTRPPQLPMVMLDCGPQDEDIPHILPDELGGASAGMQHLVELGHRDIGYIGIADEFHSARTLRRQGYEESLLRAGIELRSDRVVNASDPSTAAGRKAAQRLLAGRMHPTAVFCFSDQIAMGLIQVAQAQGLKVPDDLSVVGFDNQHYVADATWPALTTVQLPLAEMGRLAVSLALTQVNSSSAVDEGRRLVSCPLVVRDSTKPL